MGLLMQASQSRSRYNGDLAAVLYSMEIVGIVHVEGTYLCGICIAFCRYNAGTRLMSCLMSRQADVMDPVSLKRAMYILSRRRYK